MQPASHKRQNQAQSDKTKPKAPNVIQMSSYLLLTSDAKRYTGRSRITEKDAITQSMPTRDLQDIHMHEMPDMESSEGGSHEGRDPLLQSVCTCSKAH